SGHAAAAPPSAASNSRRPMVTVIRPSRARCVKETIARHERAVLAFKEGRMLLAVVRGRKRKGSVFRFAPKANLPPDLRTTPAASSSRTPPSRPRAYAADHDAVGERVVVVPLTGWAAHRHASRLDLQTIGRRVRALRATCRQ